MKYVLITTRLGAPNEDQIQYPAVWNVPEVERSKLGPLVYKGRHDKGDETGEVLTVMKDAVADKYALDRDIRILTEAEATTWLETNPNLAAVPEERITDERRLQAIQTKIAAGVALSTEDNDALDPDKPVRGINRKRKNAQSYFPTR